jgi:hypothetical protein
MLKFLLSALVVLAAAASSEASDYRCPPYYQCTPTAGWNAPTCKCWSETTAKDNNPFSGATSFNVTMHKVTRPRYHANHYRRPADINLRNFSVFTDRFQSILVWK